MSERKNIGLFVPAFLRGKGGAEKVASLLANYLSTLNYNVYLICRPATGNSASYTINEKVKLITSKLLQNDCDDLRELNLDLIIGFAMMGFSDEIAMIAKKIDVKYVVQECTNPTRMIRLMTTDRKIPFNSIRETFWLRQAFYAHSNGVRLTNPAYEASIIKTTRHKTHAFYNSLIGLEIKRMPPEQKSKKKYFDVVTVGAFKNKNKNGLAALKGFIAAYKDKRTNVEMRFHSYGDNNFTNQVAELTKDLPKTVINFHGISSDVNEMYADKDLVILPSYEEGMPNVILEAMTFGIPVIAYDDCAGADDVINASHCGLLISRKNDQNLTDAIIEMTDKELADKFSSAGLTYSEKNFSAETWQENWLKLIEQALKMPPAFQTKHKAYTKQEFDAYNHILEYRMLSAENSNTIEL